jgi:hypothetical protein
VTRQFGDGKGRFVMTDKGLGSGFDLFSSLSRGFLTFDIAALHLHTTSISIADFQLMYDDRMINS